MNTFSCPDFKIFENLDHMENTLLIIEDKKYLYSFLYDLSQNCTFHQYITIYDLNYKSLNINDYIAFIPSFIHLEVNDKKNLNALIKILKKSDICLQPYLESINKLLYQSFDQIKFESSIELEEDISFSEDDLYRQLNLSIKDNHSSLLEKIHSYIQILHELRKIKILIVYELFTWLSENEIDTLLNSCKYYNITLIDIENHDIQSNLFPIKKILDCDYCLLESNPL